MVDVDISAVTSRREMIRFLDGYSLERKEEFERRGQGPGHRPIRAGQELLRQAGGPELKKTNPQISQISQMNSPRMNTDGHGFLREPLDRFIRVYPLAAHNAAYLAGESPAAGIGCCPRSYIRRLKEATPEVKART